MTTTDRLTQEILARRRLQTDARRIRHELGLTLNDIAHAIDIPPSSLCRWERGHKCTQGYAAIRVMTLLDDLRDRTTA